MVDDGVCYKGPVGASEGVVKVGFEPSYLDHFVPAGDVQEVDAAAFFQFIQFFDANCWEDRGVSYEFTDDLDEHVFYIFWHLLCLCEKLGHASCEHLDNGMFSSEEGWVAFVPVLEGRVYFVKYQFPGDLSQPHDPAEPYTPLETPLQSSSPFVTPLPHYSLLCSAECCTFFVYSNYVPLCLQLLFPSHPGMLPLVIVLIIVSLLVMTSLICHQCLILFHSKILNHPPCLL